MILKVQIQLNFGSNNSSASELEGANGVYFKTDWNKLWNSKKGVFAFKQKFTKDALQLSDQKLCHILHFLLVFRKYNYDS